MTLEMVYRNSIISYDGWSYTWYHPDHVDASWEGDGWSTDGCGTASDIEGCKIQIDEFEEELKQRRGETL